MLFRNYHIVIFKDREGEFGNLRFRGWLCLLFILMVLGLGAGNVYLWKYYTQSSVLEHEVAEARKTIQDQNTHIVSMAGKLQTLEDSLTRIQQFDSKLRVMINVDSDPLDTGRNRDAYESRPQAGSLPLHRQDLLARRMHSLSDQLKEDVLLEEITQQELLTALRNNQDFLSSTPSIWPAEGHVSSKFGYRYNPITGKYQLHKGLDISARPGTAIIAPGRGVVTFAGWDGAYGICVMVNHGNGISSRYAHMQKATVEEGQWVNRGDLIGHVGSTGRSTGPHLHYEVHVGGVAVDPMRYIFN